MICYRLIVLILLLLLQLDIRLTTSNLYYHPADPDIGPIAVGSDIVDDFRFQGGFENLPPPFFRHGRNRKY